MSIWIRHAVLILIACAVIFPVVWMGYTAFKTDEAIRENIWLPPASPHVDNMREVWAHPAMPRGFRNSALVTLLSVVVLGFTASLAGYGFGRFSFPGKKLLWWLILAGLFLPIHVTLIPLHRLEGALGITRDWTSLLYLAAVYVAFNLSFSIFFLRGFFAAVPQDIVDAARIDGCGSFATYFRVLLPISMPAMTVLTLINAVMVWNEFVFALVLLQSSRFYTLPLAVMQFSDDTGMDIAKTCAALTLSVLPVIGLFLLFQRRIISGLTAGAIKG